MKKFLTLKDAKLSLSATPPSEKMILDQCIAHCENLTKEKINYFRKEDGGVIDVHNLFKKTDCLTDNIENRLIGLEIMVECGGPNTWINIEREDNVTVKYLLGFQGVEICLGKVDGVTLDRISAIYSIYTERKDG